MLTVKYPIENLFRVRVKRTYLGLGIPDNKIKVDIVIPRNGNKVNLNKVTPMNRDQPFVVPGPGEYEIGGTQITSTGDGYWEIRIEGWRLCYLCGKWEKPSHKKVDKLGQLDLLFLDLAGSKKEAKEAEEAVKRLSPRGIVFGYKIGKEFLDKIDREDIDAIEKVKVKHSDLTEEGTDYFALK